MCTLILFPLDPRSVVSPNTDSFPALVSSTAIPTEKQDSERLRKRRKKRKQRHRSGSISSSSSESTEERSRGSSSDRLSKPKPGSHVAGKLPEETQQEADNSSSFASKKSTETCITDTQKTKTASSDGSDSHMGSLPSETGSCTSKSTGGVEGNPSSPQQGSQGEKSNILTGFKLSSGIGVQNSVCVGDLFSALHHLITPFIIYQSFTMCNADCYGS